MILSSLTNFPFCLKQHPLLPLPFSVQAPVKHTIKGQTFWLSALRSIFWEAQQTLILSDLHFGKTGHFRKSGIAVPQQAFKEDLHRLITLLHYFNPAQLIVVGDFFHSRSNKEHELFKKWRHDFTLPITLVKGNHDILDEAWYQQAAIDVVNDLTIDSFYFSHELMENKNELYTFSGHIHPGILIKGLGKQALRFPCFYFTSQYCVLPAFSLFTGMALVYPKPDEQVYAVVENTIVRIH